MGSTRRTGLPEGPVPPAVIGDFRTPLTLLLGSVESMLEQLASGQAPTQGQLEQAHRIGRQVLERMNTLLAHDGGENGHSGSTEERYRTIVENQSEMICRFRPDGTILFVNSAYARARGTTAEALTGANFWKFVAEEDEPEVKALLGRLNADHPEIQIENRFETADEVRWTLWTNRVLAFDAAGRPTELQSSGIDITDRKRAEAALHERELHFRVIANAAPAMLWIADPHGACTFISRGWCDYVGQTEAQALGAGWMDAIHPADRDETERRFSEASARRESFSIDYRIRRFDGAYRWVLDAGQARESESGEFLGYIGSVIDVHERKLAEEALKEADRRKNEFLATLAHELRNPLAPLRNGLEVIRRARADEGAVERARTMMERQLGHMVRLIDDLLDVSRISRGRIGLHRQRVALADVIRDAVDTVRPLIEAGDQRLSLDVPTDPIFLHADPIRLGQVFANLLNNASKFSEAGGKLALAVARERDEIVIRVTDEGIGIPADLSGQVFEPFVQGTTTLERSRGGLGIGLTLVKRLVEMHGGRVEVRSDGVGAGSEFTVRLPASSSALGPTHP